MLTLILYLLHSVSTIYWRYEPLILNNLIAVINSRIPGGLTSKDTNSLG